MLLIWGFRSYIKTLAIVTGVCRQCGNPSAHRIVQRTRKFTLFFIPLFPVSKKTFSTCTFCGCTTQLDDASRDAAVAAAAAAGPQTIPVEPSPVIPAASVEAPSASAEGDSGQ